MREMDDELKNALRREEPPAGFADRVLERVAERSGIRQASAVETTGVTRSFVRWAAAAAVVVMLAGGWLQYRDVQQERAERIEGEAAKARVVLALHIASSKLQLVQTKISRMHEQPEKNSNQ